MQTIPSSTDMDELIENCENFDYYLSLIVNMEGEYSCKVAIHAQSEEYAVKHKFGKILYKPKKYAMILDCDIKFEIDELTQKRIDIVEEKKKQRTPAPYTTQPYYNNRYPGTYSTQREFDFKSTNFDTKEWLYDAGTKLYKHIKSGGWYVKPQLYRDSQTNISNTKKDNTPAYDSYILRRFLADIVFGEEEGKDIITIQKFKDELSLLISSGIGEAIDWEDAVDMLMLSNDFERMVTKHSQLNNLEQGSLLYKAYAYLTELYPENPHSDTSEDFFIDALIGFISSHLQMLRYEQAGV